MSPLREQTRDDLSIYHFSAPLVQSSERNKFHRQTIIDAFWSSISFFFILSHSEVSNNSKKSKKSSYWQIRDISTNESYVTTRLLSDHVIYHVTYKHTNEPTDIHMKDASLYHGWLHTCTSVVPVGCLHISRMVPRVSVDRWCRGMAKCSFTKLLKKSGYMDSIV